jgi:hypothetical protein
MLPDVNRISVCLVRYEVLKVMRMRMAVVCYSVPQTCITHCKSTSTMAGEVTAQNFALEKVVTKQ